MAIYHSPSNKVHRGFAYLDDETVINSLSAVESGKIDEVVAKVNSAREGGFGGGVSIYGAKVDGAKKSTSAFEEEMVRTRTRFSIFELWYQSLREGKALGSFDGWGPAALDGVKSGDTVEFRAHLEAAPIQTLLRLYLWFADKAKSQGHFFSQKGEELKTTKETERIISMILAQDQQNDEDQEIIVEAVPLGDAGPGIAMPIKKKWVIGNLGRFGGEYTVVAQVDRLIASNDELPALRLTHDVAATPLEIDTLKTALDAFKESAESFGLDLADAATIKGPALWLEPIAVFR
ncbi:DUF6414 family protein [Mycolicibacterium nivoides]|uniref:DUF6414 family protein n=1 Tax=Mycolicibacterium nivoides TaxID=2487344 RepID=UPI000F5C21B3|nr:hypothetical protein [Mycolicibacterium nivoides]